MFKKNYKKHLGAAVLCGCFAGPFAIAQALTQHANSAAARSGIAAAGVAAVVDGHAISTAEVEKIAMRRDGQEILDGLIDNYLIEQEAKRLHVKVSEAEIDNQVQTLTRAIQPETLEEGLKEHHETLAELRDDFRHRLLALKLAAMSIAPGHFVHAYVIFIKAGSGNSTNPADAHALARATAIEKQLQAGAKFQNLARRYSQDPVSRARGGDIGILFEGCSRDASVVQAALKLHPGMMEGKPVKTSAGYYLIMVSSTTHKHPTNEDKLYADAEMQYELHQGGRNLPAYLRGLRARATITRNLQP